MSDSEPTTLARPLVAYFDTATWSRIQNPRTSDDEEDIELLRVLGGTGAVFYGVSDEILEETPSDRVRVLHEFPGALDIGSSRRLLSHSAENLVRAARGIEPASLSLDFDRLASKSFETLRVRVGFLHGAHRLRRGMGIAERLSRRAHSGQGRKDLERQFRATSKLLANDLEGFVRESKDAAANPALRALGTIAHRFGTWANSRGWLPPLDVVLDPTYATCLAPYLPDAARRDNTLMRKVLGQWRNRAERNRIAPAAAAVAAVCERTEFDMRAALEDAELVDRLHAAFAPVVEIFACDSRTRTALIRANAPLAHRPADLIVGDKLDELAKRVYERVIDRFPPRRDPEPPNESSG